MKLALLLTLALASPLFASTMTVLGSMKGKIYYDNKDVGTIPLRLTQVPAGRHVVRVVTVTGVDRTFDLDYPKGQSADRVIDMDVELSRRDPGAGLPQPQQLPPTQYRPYPDVVTRYEYVYPTESDYYRNYDSRNYRSNYGVYPYGYNQPFYGGNYYGYGGYPGFYDNYGGVFNNFNTFNRGFRNRDVGRIAPSTPSAPAFSTPPPFTTQFNPGAAGTPVFTPPPAAVAQPAIPPGAGTAPFRPPGTIKRPDEP